MISHTTYLCFLKRWTLIYSLINMYWLVPLKRLRNECYWLVCVKKLMNQCSNILTNSGWLNYVYCCCLIYKLLCNMFSYMPFGSVFASFLFSSYFVWLKGKMLFLRSLYHLSFSCLKKYLFLCLFWFVWYPWRFHLIEYNLTVVSR